MHYFKRNIGDYHKKAGRLTMLQHGAYTLLLDSCYDREMFPTLEDALDWTWASTEAEIEAVKFVLTKFFTLDGGVYIQHRIESELEQYHKNSATNKRIAIERESKRKKKITKREQPVNEVPPNQEPLTTNQEPLTTNQEPLTSSKDSKPPTRAKAPVKTDDSPIMVLMPLTGDKQYELRQSQTDKWSELYPGVNLQTEVSKMIGWLDANPTKRKTARGILKFMNNWLSRAQDNGQQYQPQKPQQQQSNDISWADELPDLMERSLVAQQAIADRGIK